MPELSRFYGIVIRMYFGDHPPPHFHAEYGEYEALININTLAIIAGKLPSRALGLVIEWASLHQTELSREWEKAENLQPLDKIPPLK
ncbi:MAG: DUF4160 domain-containing protein [Chloroflexota bacterium]|nr:DUF4160 domain-containing protein [Chloroflexota bacterium]